MGAIGRQVAIILAAMGVTQLQLIDPDRVEEVNLGPQGYWPEDVGCTKVQATAATLVRINPDIGCSIVQQRYQRGMETHQVTFCCVDSIDARRFIWNSISTTQRFFVDGRMTAEALRILCVASAVDGDHYARTLFDAREAQPGTCTARSTHYCASIAGGFMVAQYTKWLRRLDTARDLVLNLLSGELSVLD